VALRDFNVVGKEFHVTESKLWGMPLASSMVGVFSYAKEKIKCEECEFSCCAKALVVGGAHVLENVVGN